jgi:acetylornithine/succinyldiaminopimelate/putrescine aminotransferase
MKFRKKPVVIEAFKWTGDQNQTEDPTWIVLAITQKKVFFVNAGTEDVELCITTLEGVMSAKRGDYIIQGIKGEIYPCKPDIFEMTYEAI